MNRKHVRCGTSRSDEKPERSTFTLRQKLKSRIRRAGGCHLSACPKQASEPKPFEAAVPLPSRLLSPKSGKELLQPLLGEELKAAPIRPSRSSRRLRLLDMLLQSPRREQDQARMVNDLKEKRI